MKRVLLACLLAISWGPCALADQVYQSDGMGPVSVTVDKGNSNYRKAQSEETLSDQEAINRLNQLQASFTIDKITNGRGVAPGDFPKASDVLREFVKRRTDMAKFLETYRTVQPFSEDPSTVKRYSVNVKSVRLDMLVALLRHMRAPIRYSALTRQNPVIVNFSATNEPLSSLLLRLSKKYSIPIRYYSSAGIYIVE